MSFGSRAAIKFLANQNGFTEEDKALIAEKFEADKICSANGTYCLKGCKFSEGEDCLRLINKKKALNGKNL